jgi:predicted choloylglycine hydrolase
MPRFIHSLLVLTSFFTLLTRAAADPFHYPAARHGKGELRYVDGMPVLSVAGSPEEIGEQIAVLGIRPAPRLPSYPRDMLRQHGLELFWQPLLGISQVLLERFPRDYRREYDAMIRAGVDPDALQAGNTFFDIKRLVACSALIVDPQRSATQGPLMGRNLDFETLGYLHEYSVITAYRPDGKHAFVSVGFPGLIGCLSGMNDAGLSVAVLEVFLANDASLRFDPNGIPFAMLVRRLLEECATVEEALKLLCSLRRGCRLNLAVCDRQGGAVFEMTPDTVVVRRAPTGVTPCANHFASRELAPPLQVNFWQTLDRFEKLEAASNRPWLDLTDVADAMRSVCFRKYTLHTLIFEPAALRMYVGMGSMPSTELPLKRVDVRELLSAPRGVD